MSETNGQLTDIYRKYRPTTLKEVKGQTEAVKTLRQFLKNGNFPHALLLTGPSGTGKTTLARILKTELKCSDMDYHEIDCPSMDKIIDNIRSITESTHLCSWGGESQIWFLEEVQSLSRATFAQQALLKALEECPKHVYFVLATTDPSKLLPAIRTRCTEIALRSLEEGVLKEIVSDAVRKEEAEVSADVIGKIVVNAQGSARKALVVLQQVMGAGTEEEQLNRILSLDTEKKAIDLARALMKKAPWSEVSKLIKDITDEPETIRRVVLGYMSSVLLNKNDQRAYLVITAFEGNFFDSGTAGLTRACYEVTLQK